jgi:hypothetical protein
MVANIAACQMLMRMKMTQECAVKVIAVDGQGQDSIEDFALLSDKDVSSMYASSSPRYPWNVSRLAVLRQRGQSDYKFCKVFRGSV